MDALDSAKSWDSVSKAIVIELLGEQVDIGEGQDSDGIRLGFLDWTNNLVQNSNRVILLTSVAVCLGSQVFERDLVEHSLSDIWKNLNLARLELGLQPLLQVCLEGLCESCVLIVNERLNVKNVSGTCDHLSSELVIATESILWVSVEPIALPWLIDILPISVNIRKSSFSLSITLTNVTESVLQLLFISSEELLVLASWHILFVFLLFLLDLCNTWNLSSLDRLNVTEDVKVRTLWRFVTLLQKLHELFFKFIFESI